MDQKSTEPHKEDPKSTRKNPNPSAQLVILIKNLKKVIYNKEHPRRHTPPTNKKPSEPVVLNWLTFILVLVNAALAAATYSLYIEASNQSGYARDAATSAKQSVEQTQENFKIENRAWVGLVREPSRMGGELDQWKASGYIQNFGKTPAESACVGVKYFASGKKLVIHRPIFDPPRVISPSQVIGFDANFICQNEDTIQKINKGELLMYLHGFVTYKDIYGGKDTTEFMFYVDTVPNAGKLVPISGHNWMK